MDNWIPYTKSDCNCCGEKFTTSWYQANDEDNHELKYEPKISDKICPDCEAALFKAIKFWRRVD